MKIRQNVTEIKRLLHERKEAEGTIYHFLISKGIAQRVAEKILSEMDTYCLSHLASPAESTEWKELEKLKECVARRIKVAGDLDFRQPHTLVCVGPTGVGKTTTILKLAEYYRKRGIRVALTSLDETKNGDMKAWALQHEMIYCENQQHPDVKIDLFLVDTEGCNFYLPNRIDALGEKISDLGEHVEVLLTLSAAAKEVDLYGAIHQFSPLCPATLIFSKLDETLASGVIVNVCEKTELPIRYITYGYPLPGEVHVADAQTITHKILADFNKEEFQFLRHLTL